MEGTKSFSHEQNGTALTSDLLVRMEVALTSDLEGTNPLTMSEWLWVSSLSLGGSLDLENTKSLSEVLELQPSQWLH